MPTVSVEASLAAARPSPRCWPHIGKQRGEGLAARQS